VNDGVVIFVALAGSGLVVALVVIAGFTGML